MKKLWALLACLGLCCILLAGCGEQQQKVEEEPAPPENDAAVVGTWTESDFDSGYTFAADGTGRELYWDLPFTYTAVDGVISITYEDETYRKDEFRYTVTESSITMTRLSGDGNTFVYTR